MATTRMNVEVPQGHASGSVFHVQTPNGIMGVTVPAGVGPGQTLTIDVPIAQNQIPTAIPTAVAIGGTEGLEMQSKQPTMIAANFQPQQPNVIAANFQPQHAGTIVVQHNPQGYTQGYIYQQDYASMIHNIIACLFCFWPTAAVGMCYSCQVQNANQRQDLQAAVAAGNQARCCFTASVAIGIVCVFILIILYAVGIATAASNADDGGFNL